MKLQRFLPLVGLLLLSTIAIAQDQELTFHWSGKLAAEKMVEIKNVNGEIDAEADWGDEVTVTATKTGKHAEKIQIEVVPYSGGVVICAIHPSSIFGGSPGRCEPDDKALSGNSRDGANVNVHFKIRMPRNLVFRAITINGNINAEDMGRFVFANSVNGEVRVSTSSWARVSTVNGAIHAKMGGSNWDGTLNISTVNGSVELEMPDDLSAEVDFSSVNGSMSSDYPLTISHGLFVGHSVHGTVGKGGRHLEVHTVNGSINLKKSTAGI